MYTVAVKRDFVAQHFLIGGDWGPENEWHSHHYAVELLLHGASLDKHGFLVDIDDIARHLDAIVAHYKDKTLNEQPEFAGLNPSIEHFARILAYTLRDRIKADNLSSLTVKVFEDDIGQASYHLTVDAD